MKKIILILFVSFSLYNQGYSEDGWSIQYTLPQDKFDDFTCICFPDSLNGFVSGHQRILHSTNGGINWGISYETIQDIVINSISFPDANHGWCLDLYNILLKTTNGGQDWSHQDPPDLLFKTSVQFTDSLNGWISSDIGIDHTTNGGINWQNQLSSGFLNKIFFKNSLTGWAVGDSCKILHTIDGGQNWTRQNYNSNQRLRSVYFSDTLHGCAVGDNGLIIYTTDGGSNWLSIDTSITTNNIYDVASTDNNNVWACGDSGLITHSIDGGYSWHLQNSSVNVRLNSITFIDSTNGWACGARYIIHTTNGGITFIENNKNDFPNIFCSPNPASDFIEIKNMNPRVNQWVDNVVIYNVMGENVLNVGAIHELPLRVDVSSLFPGLYFLRCGDQINKFMVVR